MNNVESKVKPIIWEDTKLQVLDQRLLPFKKRYLEMRSYKQVVDAIKNMTVRGAPLIGITSAYGMALAAKEFAETSNDAPRLIEKLKLAGEEIKETRPTAVNLKWAVDLILNTIFDLDRPETIVEAVEKRAVWIHEDDTQRCRQIGEYGAKVISQGARILTICNTGSLATGGIGTAFGIILTRYQFDPTIKIYVTETRPRQQGARLTTFECLENGIDCTLISDTACGYMMKTGEVNTVITGADRISANGDIANKIGTYQLAILAKEHNVSFYVAAPLSTFDLLCENGSEIPIEERDEKEVTEINSKKICVSGIKVRNPAFDITPAKYITGIITEKGIVKGNYEKEISGLILRELVS